MGRLAIQTVGAGLVLCMAARGEAQAPRTERPRDMRYQIGVMERILEEAVQHGADKTRERIQSVLPPADMLLVTSAQVRGFRLEGYGVFFDVEVPTLDTSIPLSFKMLDQTGLGLDSALQAFKQVVQKSNDVNLEQALRRIELQIGPMTVAQTSTDTTGARMVSGSAATADDTPQTPVRSGALPVSSVENYLNEVHATLRAEVRDALIDAMLDHGRGLDVSPNEWLQVAARRDDARARLGPVDADVETMSIRVRGADLMEFLGGKITREEAIKRIDVKMF